MERLPLLKIAAVTTMLITASIGAFWWIYVRAPDPAEVCHHKIELTQSELGKEGERGEVIVEGLKARCEGNEARRIKLRGKIKYAERARCIVKAKSLGEAERC